MSRIQVELRHGSGSQADPTHFERLDLVKEANEPHPYEAVAIQNATTWVSLAFL